MSTLKAKTRVSALSGVFAAVLGLTALGGVANAQPADACTVNPTANCEYSQDTADSLTTIRCAALIGVAGGLTGGTGAIVTGASCLLPNY